VLEKKKEPPKGKDGKPIRPSEKGKESFNIKGESPPRKKKNPYSPSRGGKGGGKRLNSREGEKKGSGGAHWKRNKRKEKENDPPSI